MKIMGTWTSKVSKIMVQHPEIECMGSVESIILGILAVQEYEELTISESTRLPSTIPTKTLRRSCFSAETSFGFRVGLATKRVQSRCSCGIRMNWK